MIAKGNFVRGPKVTRSKSGAVHKRSVRQVLTDHLKYLEHRPRDEAESRAERSFFSKDRDHASRQDIIDEMMQHTSPKVDFHRFLLSPADNEPVADQQRWTRQVMADLERKLGKELHWYAIAHKNTAHHHVHIVLAGAGEDRESGKAEPVILRQDEYAYMRERGREHSDYEIMQLIKQALEEEQEHQQQRELLGLAAQRQHSQEHQRERIRGE